MIEQQKTTTPLPEAVVDFEDLNEETSTTTTTTTTSIITTTLANDVLVTDFKIELDNRESDLNAVSDKILKERSLNEMKVKDGKKN